MNPHRLKSRDEISKKGTGVVSGLAHKTKIGSKHKGSAFIGELKVEPQDQRHMSLGIFTQDSRLKGFVVEFTPDPNPEESVVAQIATLDEGKQYKLILHVANYGTKSITATVWNM